MHRGPEWSRCLAVSDLRHTCTGSRSSRGLSVVAIWNHIGKSIVQPLFSLSSCLFLSGCAFLVFCLPSILPPPLFSFFFFSSSFHCYNSVMGAWRSLCVGAHGWVAGIASRGSWLITVEAPGHLRHPPSTQLD